MKIAALHVQRGEVAERFCALLKPGRRVPRYVLARAGIDAPECSLSNSAAISSKSGARRCSVVMVRPLHVDTGSE